MSIYWKVAVWVFLVGQLIGLFYALTSVTTTTFALAWLVLGIAISIKLLDLSKQLENFFKSGQLVQNTTPDVRKEEEKQKKDQTLN